MRPAAERPPVARPRLPDRRAAPRADDVEAAATPMARDSGRDSSRTSGPNAGLVEELYRQYLENPASVAERWRDFFADYTPDGARPAAGTAPGHRAAPPHRRRRAAAPAPRRSRRRRQPAARLPPPATGPRPARRRPLRGARRGSSRTWRRASRCRRRRRSAPCRRSCSRSTGRSSTTTSAAAARGKVSFTHLIAFAVVAGARAGAGDELRATASVDGKPGVVRHEHVNLGLAVDVEQPDGTRTLLVPNIKDADTLDFAAFFAAYEDADRARCARTSSSPDDFAGTTGTITNPGTIGTVHSVPRLMPGQGVHRRRRRDRLPGRVRGRRPADARPARHQQDR